MTLNTYSRRNLAGIKGIGDCTADNTDEFGMCVTGVTTSTGVPISSTSTPVPGAACYPPTFVGPLPPGAGYCSTPTGLPAPATGLSCPAGSACTFFNGVPDTAVYTLAALLAGFMIYGVTK